MRTKAANPAFFVEITKLRQSPDLSGQMLQWVETTISRIRWPRCGRKDVR